MKLNKGTDLPITFKSKAHEALVSVWWTGVLLRKAFRKFFRAHIRSEAQFNLLIILKDSGHSLTQTELSNMLFVDRSNVTGLIDGLESDGLITRNRVKRDRRSYHISLTARGKKLTKKLEKLYVEEVRRIMAGFSARESADLARLTNKLRSGLEK